MEQLKYILFRQREIERFWLDYYGLDGLFVDAKVQFKMTLPKFSDDEVLKIKG
jgi:hypothetical protein